MPRVSKVKEPIPVLDMSGFNTRAVPEHDLAKLGNLTLKDQQTLLMAMGVEFHAKWTKASTTPLLRHVIMDMQFFCKIVFPPHGWFFHVRVPRSTPICRSSSRR